VVELGGRSGYVERVLMGSNVVGVSICRTTFRRKSR